MVKEPGFGMILKSAGPEDVYRPPAPFAATRMGEYGVIIGDEKGVKKSGAANQSAADYGNHYTTKRSIERHGGAAMSCKDPP